MKIIEFLTPDRRRFIQVPYFLKNYYIKYKYLRVPKNILLKKFFLYINLKILAKIKILFDLFFRSTFFFKEPVKCNIIIFDKAEAEPIKSLLPNNNFKVIANRIEDVNEIFFSYRIIFFILKNFFKRNLRLNYLIAIIKLMEPKKVITHSDHSLDFHNIANFFKKSEIKFIAIQLAGRAGCEFKELYVPNYFTFGEYEKNLYNKKEQKNNIFFPVGSLRPSMALEYFKKNKLDYSKAYYDICVISEPRRVINGDFAGNLDMNENRALILRHAIKYSEKFKKKIIISGKSDIENEKEKEFENIVYTNYLNDLKFKINFNSKKQYGSYLNLMRSKIIIGSKSTLLQEALGMKKKVLFCDYENIPELILGISGICVLNDKSYLSFEKRVHEILNMNYEDYTNKINLDINYIYNTKVDTVNFIKNFLKK